MTTQAPHTKRHSPFYSLLVTAILLSIGLVLPFLTGQVQVLGQAISPLHIPVFICGLCCGWRWGMVLGMVLPLLRSAIFGMPPLVPMAIPMTFELAIYGAVCGLLYPRFRRQPLRPILAMMLAMLVAKVPGCIVGGAIKAIVMGLQGNPYSFQSFLTGYVTTTVVGTILHFLLIPAIVTALEKAGLSPLIEKD